VLLVEDRDSKWSGGGRLARAFFISPLPLFMLFVISHRPGFIVCAAGVAAGTAPRDYLANSTH
jgi:hypothetical protein